ncbi:alpha-1,2-fucosyltransferase [Sinomonas sp. ASV322]|uniref:alpha-1,2-fucosyltransferase n=1 Tax=Sinomonas sp. ASV322 TaxID=3041920 RepID=UPI0027DC4304|nr:alpha-1,2-fucosyltransferase [Sinomonas sp. ASV322]MDQ4501362.1 alpha-1,2-fucosyltransferase [Sinomonas sp. ASV322]
MLTDLRSALFTAVRRGPQTVLWPPSNIGVGNLLYFWLQAHARQERGQDVVVRWTNAMQPWEGLFPEIFESLVARDRDISFFSPRDTSSYFQEFGDEFTQSELDRFIDSFVLGPRSSFRQLVHSNSGHYDLTVNVRRGDYYSDPKYRGIYSFDVVEYVRTALEAARASEPIQRIHVVSDDIEWCRAKLDWKAVACPVTYQAEGSTVGEQLAVLAASPRLILTNSTFSYWGGYLSSRIHGTGGTSNHGRIWAPWFHRRDIYGGRAPQLDPRWSTIREIRGGWDG